jgi:predicted amidophosphoribosyltransferase
MRGVQDVVCADRCCGCGAGPPPLCGNCRLGLSPSADPCSERDGVRILTALAYEGSARQLVLALKLRCMRPAAGPLVSSLVELVQRRGLGADVLAWVPGRAPDIRRRGFDHAHVLAEGVAAGLGLPLLPLLDRAGSSEDQAGLGRRQRWANVAGAFRGRPTLARVAVVDDLVTSGATARAVASALVASGASGVEIVAACRVGGA